MRIRSLFLAALSACLLAGCSPTYNWRDHTSADGSYRVMFPAKPATHTRNIDLGGIRVDMTMTGADVEGAAFVVGTALMPDAALAQASLPALRQALLRNIGAADGAAAARPNAAALDVDATTSDGKLRLVGRFVAKGARIYQVIVVGPPKTMPPEQADQFLTSFAPQ
jgi:hypothetical protein